MFRYINIILGYLALLLVLTLMNPPFIGAWSGKVVKVIDGDTIEVRKQDKSFRIRFYGIDAPEYNRPFSKKARIFTKRLTLHKNVEIIEKDIDRYGRIVALVIVNDLVVNEALVKAGLAWVYEWFCREQPLCDGWLEMERFARKQKKGLWRHR